MATPSLNNQQTTDWISEKFLINGFETLPVWQDAVRRYLAETMLSIRYKYNYCKEKNQNENIS